MAISALNKSVRNVKRNCERSEQPLAKGEEPGQTNTKCEHVNVKEFLDWYIFLASPGLFLQKIRDCVENL